jgi:hypothetical protein
MSEWSGVFVVLLAGPGTTRRRVKAITQIMPPKDNGVIPPRTHSRFEPAQEKEINSCACGWGFRFCRSWAAAVRHLNGSPAPTNSYSQPGKRGFLP